MEVSVLIQKDSRLYGIQPTNHLCIKIRYGFLKLKSYKNCFMFVYGVYKYSGIDYNRMIAREKDGSWELVFVLDSGTFPDGAKEKLEETVRFIEKHITKPDEWLYNFQDVWDKW